MGRCSSYQHRSTEARRAILLYGRVMGLADRSRRAAAKAAPSCGIGDTRHQRSLAGEPQASHTHPPKERLGIGEGARCRAPHPDLATPSPTYMFPFVPRR